MEHLERLEDASYFFKPIGSLQVCPAFGPKGYSRLLAVAPHTGLLFWASGNSVCWAFTKDVVEAAAAAATGSSAKLDTHLIDLIQPHLATTVAIVSVSPEEEELAVGFEGGAINVFSLKNLLQMHAHGGGDYTSSQIWAFHFERGPRALMWQGKNLHCLLGNGQVHVASVSTKAVHLYEEPSILAYGVNQSTGMCAFSSKAAPDHLVITKDHKKVDLKIEVEDDGDVFLESIHWQDDNTILLGCIIQVEGEEDDAAFIQLVTLDGEVLEQQHLKNYVVDTMTVQGRQFGANHGPYLHTCDVQDWGITVMAHSKSDDMHFRVLGSGFEASNETMVLELPWEGTVTIPMTQDDEDNYIVGIGMDFTSSTVPVSWKVGDTLQELQPCPVLAVATTDGHLRFFSFGYVHQPFSLVHAPRYQPDAVLSKEIIAERDYESLPDAPIGSGSVSEPVSPAQTKSSTAEDNTTPARSHSSSQTLEADDSVLDNRRSHHEPMEENAARSNLNMNVNPIYDTSSINSSTDVSAVQPCHSRNATVPQDSPHPIPTHPPGLKVIPKDPPGILKDMVSPYDGPAPGSLPFSKHCSSSGAGSSKHPPWREGSRAFQQLTPDSSVKFVEDSKLFGSNPLASHILKLEFSRQKLAQQMRQMKDVDELVGKTRNATRRIAMLKEKVQDLKCRRACEEAEDEVKMRVNRIEEAYKRVSSGLETLNLLQSFCHGNRQVNCTMATRQGQTAYYAVTETLQGVRTVANNLRTRIRRVESWKEGKALAPKRTSQDSIIQARSSQIRTPWSCMTPEESITFLEKIRSRKPATAYAPGLAPKISATIAHDEPRSYPQQAKYNAPPLPPTRINVPGVEVAKQPDVPHDYSSSKPSGNKTTALPNAAGKVKPLDECISSSTSAKQGQAAPSTDRLEDSLGKDKMAPRPLGSSFGSPASLVGAVTDGMRGDKIPIGNLNGFFPLVSPPTSQPVAPSISRASLFSPGDTSTSILGSPAMSGRTGHLATPPSKEESGIPAAFPGSSTTDTPPPKAYTSPAKDPSPFSGALPEDAQDQGGSSSNLNFSGLSFGQSHDNGSIQAGSGVTAVFGAVSAPAEMKPLHGMGSVPPFSSMSLLGESGQKPDSQSAGGIFGGFGQQAPSQRSIFGPPMVAGMGERQDISPAHGSGFGAPAVLGAGGVANQLGSSLHGNSGGYANLARSGNAFANLVPQNGPAPFGNQSNAAPPLFGGMVSGTSFQSPSSSTPAPGSIFGRIGMTNQTSPGFGAGSAGAGRPMQMGQSSQQDNSLWKPRR